MYKRREMSASDWADLWRVEVANYEFAIKRVGKDEVEQVPRQVLLKALRIALKAAQKELQAELKELGVK